LWTLAVSDAAVRQAFVTHLVRRSEELERFGQRPDLIGRALGLEWPTSSQAEQIARKAVVQVGRTTDPFVQRALAQTVQALAENLSEADAQIAFAALLQQVDQTNKFDATRQRQAKEALGAALRALAPKLGEVQTQAMLAVVLQHIGQTTDPDTLWALSDSLRALAPKLSEAQSRPALLFLLQQIGQTTDSKVQLPLARTVRSLVQKLRGAQAGEALSTILKQIGQMTDRDALFALSKAVQELARKLSDMQAEVVLASVLQQIGEVTDLNARLELARAVCALAPNLSGTQAQVVLKTIFQRMEEPIDTSANLIRAVYELAPMLSEAQAQTILEALLRHIERNVILIGEESLGRPLLRETAHALASKLNGLQVPAVLATAVEEKDSWGPGPFLFDAVEVLTEKFSESQADAAVPTMLQQIGNATSDEAQSVESRKHRNRNWALSTAVRALAPKLSDVQAQATFTMVLQKIGETNQTGVLLALSNAVGPLAAKLSETQREALLAPILQQFTQTDDLNELLVVAAAPWVNETEADVVLAKVLTKIGQRTDWNARYGLSAAVRALAPKLNATQAQTALTAMVLQQKEADPSFGAGALFTGMKALAPRLSDAQARAALALILQSIIEQLQYPPGDLPVVKDILPLLASKDNEYALKQLTTALAWAPSSEVAQLVTAAIVSMPSELGHVAQIRRALQLLRMPMSAGKPTETLLEALRDMDPRAPGSAVGLAANLAWIRAAYSQLAVEITNPPNCLMPPPEWRELACPEAANLSAETVRRD
jgi:hypothetical protein